MKKFSLAMLTALAASSASAYTLVDTSTEQVTDGYPVALGWPSGGSRGGSRMARKSWSFGRKEAQDFCEKEPWSERGKMAP